jgi:hypothetical protein
MHDGFLLEKCNCSHAVSSAWEGCSSARVMAGAAIKIRTGQVFNWNLIPISPTPISHLTVLGWWYLNIVSQQMKRSFTYTLAVAALIAVGLASYRLGLQAGTAQTKESFGSVLASVQADLGINTLQRLRALESDLARGCSREALAKIRFDIDLQLYVLSTFYKDYKGTWVVDGLAKRDPTLPGQLEGFKKQYGSSWTEPRCAA